MGALSWNVGFNTLTKNLSDTLLEWVLNAEKNQQNINGTRAVEMPKLLQQTEKRFKASAKRAC